MGIIHDIEVDGMMVGLNFKKMPYDYMKDLIKWKSRTKIGKMGDMGLSMSWMEYHKNGWKNRWGMAWYVKARENGWEGYGIAWHVKSFRQVCEFIHKAKVSHIKGRQNMALIKNNFTSPSFLFVRNFVVIYRISKVSNRIHNKSWGVSRLWAKSMHLLRASQVN